MKIIRLLTKIICFTLLYTSIIYLTYWAVIFSYFNKVDSLLGFEKEDKLFIEKVANKSSNLIENLNNYVYSKDYNNDIKFKSEVEVTSANGTTTSAIYYGYISNTKLNYNYYCILVSFLGEKQLYTVKSSDVTLKVTKRMT